MATVLEQNILEAQPREAGTKNLARRVRNVPDLRAAVNLLMDRDRHVDALKLMAEMPTVGSGDRVIEKRRAECLPIRSDGRLTEFHSRKGFTTDSDDAAGQNILFRRLTHRTQPNPRRGHIVSAAPDSRQAKTKGC